MEHYLDLIKRSETLEKELLSRLITRQDLIPLVSSIVTKDHFAKYSRVFAVMQQAHADGTNVISEVFEIGKKHKIKVDDILSNESISYRNPESIAKNLKETASSIAVYNILASSVEHVPEKKISAFVSDLQQQLARTVIDTKQETIQKMVEDYEQLQAFYYERFKNNDGIIGLSCGYSKLDDIIDGIRAPHIWVINAYTSRGKTNALLNIIAQLIQDGRRVVFYSLEMPESQIISRLLGIITGLPPMSILKGKERSNPVVLKAIDLIKKSKLAILTNQSLSDIQFSMYAEHIREPVDVFALDYVQLVLVDGAGEYEAMTKIATEFQATMKKLNVPMIQLSQISNEGARAQGSEVIAVKGSGAIAAAADLCINIRIGEEDHDTWKRKMNDGESVSMKWDVQKNRHGRVGELDMTFEGRTGRFYPDKIDEQFDKF